MIQLGDWARDLLMSRGALVESEGEGRTARAGAAGGFRQAGRGRLAIARFQRARRRGRSRRMDGPAERAAASIARGVRRAPAHATRRMGRIDADAILNRELVIQNGVWRLVEDYAGAMPYYLFSFQYTVESDERTIGYASVCLNGAARAMAEQPERLLRSVRDEPGGRSRVYRAGRGTARALSAGRARRRSRSARAHRVHRAKRQSPPGARLRAHGIVLRRAAGPA